MTVKTLKKRLSDRRVTDRQPSLLRGSSVAGSSSGPDASESYHHRPPGSSSTSQHAEIEEKRRGIVVDHSPAVKAAEETRANFRRSLPRSLIQAHDTRDCVAPFRRDEIVFGPKLGSGEFSNVYEVQSFRLHGDFSDTAIVSEEELDKRSHMKTYEKYRETKNARYAVKHIMEEYHLQNDSTSYMLAASDLAMEAEFIASLQHPNIIKLRGIASAGATGFLEGPAGYFLIIDRLGETLDQRLKRWRAANPQNKERTSRMSRLSRSLSRSLTSSISSSFSNLSKSTSSQPEQVCESQKMNEKQKMRMDERLSIAIQISAAMVYLHTHSIIFRDLKPTNIGFDVRGDVKIFDFGLARVVPEKGDPNIETFDMSGAGSPRYMAPECLSRDRYNLKADVYSFAIIVWELISGQTPYMFARRRHQLINYVVEENGRPDIDESWPNSIQGMLESSFDADIDKRPKMTLWYDIIRETLVSLRNGDRSGLNDSWIKRRRSLDSMRNIVESLKRGSISSSAGSNRGETAMKNLERQI